MNNKKKLLKWLKNLTDEEFSYYLKNRENIFNTSEIADNKNLSYLKNIDNLIKPKKIEKQFYQTGYFRFAMSFIIIIALCFSILFFVYQNNIWKSNTAIASSVTGNIYSIDKNNRKKIIINNTKLKENHTIFLEDNSKMDLQIGKNINISLKENSEIFINELKQLKGKEKNILLLNKGSLNSKITTLKKGSYLIIETNSFSTKISGTEFRISQENNKSKISVIEGKVLIQLKINIQDEINKIDDKEIINKINEVINNQIELYSNDNFQISLSEIKVLENNLNNIIKEIIKSKNINDMEGINKNISSLNSSFKKIIQEHKSNEDIESQDEIEIEEETDQNENTNENDLIENETNIIEDQDIDETKFEIISPGKKYYESNPKLQYTINKNENINNIYLNKEKIKIENDNILSSCITGFNELEIEILDNSGEITKKTVEFFVNKMKLRFNDNFNRPNSLKFGNNWQEKRSGIDNILELKNNKLIAKGSYKKSDFAILMHKYNSYEIEEFIQKIDLSNFINSQNNYQFELGIEGNLRVITAVLDISNSNAELNIIEFDGQAQKTIKMTEKTSPIKINNKLELVFYIKDRNFYALFLLNNNIIKKVEKIKHYSIQPVSDYNYLRINIRPLNNNDINEVLLEADNYKYYE